MHAKRLGKKIVTTPADEFLPQVRVGNTGHQDDAGLVWRIREPLNRRPPLDTWPIAIEQDNRRSQFVRQGAPLLARFGEVHVQWFQSGNARKNAPVLVAHYEGNDRNTGRQGHSTENGAGEQRMYPSPHTRHAKTAAAMIYGL